MKVCDGFRIQSIWRRLNNGGYDQIFNPHALELTSTLCVNQFLITGDHSVCEKKRIKIIKKKNSLKIGNFRKISEIVVKHRGFKRKSY